MQDPPASATTGAGRDNHDRALSDSKIVEYTRHDKMVPRPSGRIVACAGETGAILTG